MFQKRIFPYLNIQALFQGILLSVSFIFVGFLLITKRYLFYIHPRYEWVLWLSLLLLALGVFASYQNMKKPIFYQGKSRLYVFAFPILLLLLSMEVPEFSKVSLKPHQEQVVTEIEGLAPLELTENTSALLISNDPVERLPSVSGAIKIDTSDYAAWLSKVLSEPEAYVGKTYTFLGRINKIPYAPEGQFLLGRPVMLCCAADSQNLGLFASLPESLQNSQGHWFYFTVELQNNPKAQEGGTQVQSLLLDIKQFTRAGQPASSFAFYFGTGPINEEVDP